MAKLLIDNTTKEGVYMHPQKVIGVHATGGYYKQSMVLWDDRKDGPLVFDEEKLGGYERSGNELVFNQSKKDKEDQSKREYEIKEREPILKRERQIAFAKDKKLTPHERIDALLKILGMDK